DFDWIGGQMTSQAVPPDEHPWIEEEWGCTRHYADYRRRVRQAYRRLDLTEEAAANDRLNPGGGWVSRICHLPEIGHEVLMDKLTEIGSLDLIRGPLRRIETRGDEVLGAETDSFRLEAPWFFEATETGSASVLAGAEVRVGAESRREFGEPDAPDEAEPHCQQGLTWCCLLGWDPTGDHTIPEPPDYHRWRTYTPPDWPGRLLSFTYPNVQTGAAVTIPLFPEPGEDRLTWFSYRQVVEPKHHREPREAATVMNWPQNDLLLGSVLEDDDQMRRTLEDSRNLTRAVIHWLQVEEGFRGLRLRPDLAGTQDGLAQAPYIRESRRMVTLETMKQQDVASAAHPDRDRAPEVANGVAIGAYRLDLHPRINGRPTLDVGSLPYQVPLGSLVPVRLTNLLPCCKNFGVTHIANGCTRLHPTEWAVGEAAAVLAVHARSEGIAPQQVHASADHTAALLDRLISRGCPVRWPEAAVLRAL
ncbi:MAG: FAD-dependent oxidoreductase, partial [Fimbriimonadaceae bacterium]|nr:FAD-dependent oxidoreductase [Fimbriimonadaceae bacterium]